MPTNTSAALGTATIELPACAPLVRVTAGAGSAGQKTWNLRRPVTLIGARRPAHIVLHDRNISKAHCAIVNTGSDVLLKDLHTSSGTFCDNQRVDLVLLKDGDVIRVGDMKIQVAIQIPENENDDSGCGFAYVDPTTLPTPVTLRLDHSSRQWTVSEAVTLIGRHPGAPIRLDLEAVSTRHALLFRFANGPAIYDLGGGNGTAVNGTQCVLAQLASSDRIGIGPCTLRVDPFGPAASPTETIHDEAALPSDVHSPGPRTTLEADAASDGDACRTPADDEGGDESVCDGAPVPSLPVLDLDALEAGIADSWNRLNRWHARIEEDSEQLSAQRKNLAEREAELEAREASLRGLLHDLTQYQEQIAAREEDLAAMLARNAAEQQKLTEAQSDCTRREAEIERRSTEFKRREHVLAQRWARLLAATCPHCGKPVRTELP